MWRSAVQRLIFKFPEQPIHQHCHLSQPIIKSPAHFSISKSFSNISNPNSLPDENHSTNYNPSSFPKKIQRNDLPEGFSLFENKVFDEMPHRVFDQTPVINIDQVDNIVSVLKNANGLESRLDEMCLSLNDRVIFQVLETPLVPGENLIKFFNWVSKKQDYSWNPRIVNCLVNAVGKALKMKEIYVLWDLVKDIGENKKGKLHVEILNQIISLFWRLGRGKLGLEVFDKIEEFGCVPNSDSYYFTIEALYRCSMYEDAWSVCEKMIDTQRLPDDNWKIGHIVSCFCKGNMHREAYLVYKNAKRPYKSPPVACIKHLIRGLCKENDTVQLAVRLLDELSGDGRKHAIKLFSNVLCGLCRIRDIEGSKRLLFDMIKEGPPPGNAVFNSVITLLCKSGKMEEVTDLVYIMEDRGLRPDVYTYCVIMSGYAKRGQMDEATRMLSVAKNNHSKLSPVAYHILTRAYCKRKEFDKAVELLNEMKVTGIQPNADEYNKMIQSLCLKALDWRTAEKLLEEMKENGLHLSEFTQCLIRAVTELGEDKTNTERESPQVDSTKISDKSPWILQRNASMQLAAPCL